MKKFILFFVFINSICINAQFVNCDNVFKIEIPNNMYLMDQNSSAVFEAANYKEDYYLMVLHESKLEFKKALGSKSKSLLNEYVNIVADGYDEAFKSRTKISDFKFKDYNSKKIEIEGVSGGVEIIWNTIAIETDLYLYQICYWTTPNNKSEKNLKKLLSFAKTFEEL